MNRNLFVKSSGLSLLGLVLAPINNLIAKKSSGLRNNLYLGSNTAKSSLVQIKGQFLDSKTGKLITAKLKVQKSVAGISFKDSFANSENFLIQTQLGDNFAENLKFKVEANGYKTFEGNFTINKVSVSINSDFWVYNPQFNMDLNPRKHTIENGILKAGFNFHLVKL